MAQKKYVSLARLENFLDNIRAKFASKVHQHTLGDITDYTVDTELSTTSTNPVQNKVVNAEFDAIADAMGALDLAVDGKANTIHSHELSDISGLTELQSDWSINDPANPAYVQNRTHWADAPQTHVLCDSQNISLVYDAENAISEASFSFVQVPNMENPFIFVFDGTSYDVRIQRFGGARVGFGNLSITNDGEDSGEPFVCSTLNGLNWTISTKDTSNTTHTIESYYITQECHQLDRKYLPDDAILPIIYEEDNGFTLVSQDGKWCVQQPVGMSTGVGGEIFNSYYGDFINEAGVNAHAEGETTKARGQASHTAGQGTIANSLGQYVYGTYNIEDDGEPELPGTPERGKRKYAHIVGNGDNNSRRSNAHTLAWDGTAWFAGNVKVGGTGQDDTAAKTLATTEYVDEKLTQVDLSAYYTKSEIDSLELITVDDIDTICGGTIQYANDVMF